jgi:hypothetical protein
MRGGRGMTVAKGERSVSLLDDVYSWIGYLTKQWADVQGLLLLVLRLWGHVCAIPIILLERPRQGGVSRRALLNPPEIERRSRTSLLKSVDLFSTHKGLQSPGPPLLLPWDGGRTGVRTSQSVASLSERTPLSNAFKGIERGLQPWFI